MKYIYNESAPSLKSPVLDAVTILSAWLTSVLPLHSYVRGLRTSVCDLKYLSDLEEQSRSLEISSDMAKLSSPLQVQNKGSRSQISLSLLCCRRIALIMQYH